MVFLDDSAGAGGGVHDAETPTGRFRTQHDWEGTHSISTSVVKAVSAVSGDAPATIGPLYEVVNPDALNELLTSVRGDERATVTFSFHECGMAIHGTGKIDNQPADTDSA